MDGLLLFTPSQRKVHLGMSCCRGFYTRHWFAANTEIGTAKTKHVLNNPERKKLALSDLFSQIIFKIKIYTNCRINWFRCTTGVQLGLIIITLFIKHTTFKHNWKHFRLERNGSASGRSSHDKFDTFSCKFSGIFFSPWENYLVYLSPTEFSQHQLITFCFNVATRNTRTVSTDFLWCQLLTDF
jgi:hypothetical protein